MHNKAAVWGGLMVASGLCLPLSNHAYAQQGGSLALEEVVVTAQRRVEMVTDVPIAMTVVSGEDLARAGIDSSRELGLVVPGLHLTEQGSFAQPKIRGVGTSIVGPGADGNVAIYVDGVYQPSQSAALFDFVDVASIEVLKGPQGSLYGRNATGGAIVVSTAPPSFNVEGSLGVTYARFDESRISAYVTGPLTETVAASIAFMRRSDEGYTKNVVSGKQTSRVSTTSVRGKVLWEPTDDLSATLSARFIDQEDNVALSYAPINGINIAGDTVASALGQSDTSKISLDFDPVAEVEGGGLTLNLDYETAWGGTLTSITSYSSLNQPFGTDVDGTEVPILGISSTFDQETWIQELIYATDLADWATLTTGATYYYDESSTVGDQYVGGMARPQLIGSVDTTAYAVYGEVTVNATDRIALIFGGRYSEEKKEALGRVGAGTAPVVDDSETWYAFTPRASVRYDINQDSSVYFTYSEGFKSGIYNITGMDSTPVEPEEIKSYEIGYKLNAGRVQLSTSVFYYDYTDIQVYAIDNSSVGAGVSRISNAASAKIQGVDGEFTARLTEEWLLKGGFAYTDTEYEDYVNALVYTPAPGNRGNIGVFRDVSGNELERTPKFTSFATLAYSAPIATGTVGAAITASYNSGYYWDAGNYDRLEQDAFTVVNAEVSWTSPSDKYTVTLFGTNLLDEEYYAFVRTSQFGDTASYSRPWSAGVSLDMTF